MVSGKKETKMLFVISSIKLGQFLWNLVHSFLNKLAANNVSTLPCKTCNAHCASGTTALSEKVTLKFIAPQLWSPNSSDLNQVDYSVWEYCERRCTKHASLIWSYRRSHWLMATALMTVLSRCFSFVQISDKYSEHLLLQYSHTL